MAALVSDEGARQSLSESLLELGTKAFHPSTVGSPLAAESLEKFNNLIQSAPTVALIPVLNVLIQPGRVPQYLKTEFLAVLARLPLQQDGVRASLEFVFSVHPSNSSNEPEAAASVHRQGASITHEALKMATMLLASPPVGISADEWFKGISTQLLSLLDGRDGLELAKVASYVIGFGILGRRSYGAPGAPGWKHFVAPILGCIDPTIGTYLSKEIQGEDDIVDLRASAASVVVPQESVAESLRRLQTLILSHPNPGLTRRLLGPILLPLWALSSWPAASPSVEEMYSLPARNMLKIYLRITASIDNFMLLVRNLLYNGCQDPQKQPQWAYRAFAATRGGNGICIVTTSNGAQDTTEWMQSNYGAIKPKADSLLELMETVLSDDDITAVFLNLLSRWLSSEKTVHPQTSGPVAVKVKVEELEEESEGAGQWTALFEGSMLQRIMEKCPEKLAGRPGQLLELVQGLLAHVDMSTLAQDVQLPVILSLLNLVITSPGFRRANHDEKQIQSIEEALGKISDAAAAAAGASGLDPGTAATAKNLLLFLKYKDKLDEDVAAAESSMATVAQPEKESTVEARKTYRLALSYIMQADAPPPVRSEGLHLLQGLIQENSPILDVPAVLALLSSMLDENEDYVNLKVIQLFTLMAHRHPQSTTRELLDNYLDTAETKKLDTRLRFGEALLQVVERLGETFAGETAQQVGQALLETAGRRGVRPKTQQRQAREERRRAMAAEKRAKMDDADAEDDGNDGEDAADADDNEILQRIVDGWGSQNGAEDVRIRASALSVLATGIDTHLAGLGAPLTSGAVDLCLHILTLEPEPEKAILRRAAVVLLSRFVVALNRARERGSVRPGGGGSGLGAFSLTPQSQADILRILRYVAGTDNDGLVQQQAADVVESLENWQMISLVPPTSNEEESVSLSGLSGLSGLSRISLDAPSTPSSSDPTSRPRIEEIE